MASTPTASVCIEAPAAEVFDVITDPSTYPDWLLGAQRIRRVDPSWPAPGSAFHHTVGFGPLRVNDRTTVLHRHPPTRLSLRAYAGPVGVAHVTFEVHERDGHTEVELAEVPAAGLLRVLWVPVLRPLLSLGIWGRNQPSLDRLKTYVEGVDRDDGRTRRRANDQSAPAG